MAGTRRAISSRSRRLRTTATSPYPPCHRSSPEDCGDKSIIQLSDKYEQEAGQVFLTANHALVRMLLDQARRDRAAGLRTAGYVSGYRGSPLGVLDSALWGAQSLLDVHNIRFAPGLNEELAVSAIRGTQELAWFGQSEFEGVYGLWYGKGIGTDRACESLKLGNLEGAAARGGFLAVSGDDHGGKSSDSAHQSEHTMIAALMPILYPATIEEIISFGLFGWAMSRYSGCYVGMKCVTDTLDISGCIELPDPHRPFHLPTDIELPGEGLNLLRNLPPLEEESRLLNHRLPAATAFARANGIDRVEIDGPTRRLAIVSAGKAYLDVRQALRDLGLDEPTCQRLGIRLYKPGLIWPMDGIGLREFARGSEALLVVEEKRPVMEDQIATELYALADGQRPALAGKRDLQGKPLLPAAGELSSGEVRRAIAAVLQQLDISDPGVVDRADHFRALEARAGKLGSGKVRPAYFCSGCPHNTSTRLPEGSRAMGGIGCHGLAAVVMDRDTEQFMPMGHEGSPWVSLAGFVDTPHMFQNMGDGTYSHSGVLAVRAAVAADANITYKLLYNDAVAMTGGQPVEQQISPVDMVLQLRSEGVKAIRLVSDHPEHYRGIRLPDNASVHHRDELDTIQRELRATPGVTAIVYEQTCAAEKRRRRKRGLMPDPDQRLFINSAVCEGCGDCSVQSNCISVLPLETGFGRKRRIDQSSCNKDYSCAKGFCPSFVTVTGARIARHSVQGPRLASLLEQLPAPATAPLEDRGYNILIAGIGGTGVLTLGALLGMAAHIDGRGSSVLDMTGMAQKGGSVTSHIRIQPAVGEQLCARLGEGMSDLVIACDMIVGSGASVLKTVNPGHTVAVVNSNVAPTGEFQANRFVDLGEAAMLKSLREALGDGELAQLDASQLSTALTGDSIGTNILMLGYALQRGLLPVSAAAIEEAIRLNGAFVERNLYTLALGRLAAVEPEALREELGDTDDAVPALDTLEDILRSREQLLEQYQDSAYAGAYRDFIEQQARLLAGRDLPGAEEYLRQVALTLGRLMAYKDEYEVARLYSRPEFLQELHQQFAGDFTLEFNLAPPLLPGRDTSGRPKKRRFGPWVLPLFRMLQHGKALRGTPFDPFGYTAERRMERHLIEEYRELVASVTPRLSAGNLQSGIAAVSAAVEIAGYGPVKAQAVEDYRAALPRLLEQFDRDSTLDKGVEVVAVQNL